MSARMTLADLPAPDAVTCRRLLALFAQAASPTISEPIEIEVEL